MNTIQAPDLSRSHLFLVRVWPEQGSDGQVEWRGRLQDVVSGEARTFQGCTELVEVLVAMLPGSENDSPDGTGD